MIPKRKKLTHPTRSSMATLFIIGIAIQFVFGGQSTLNFIGFSKDGKYLAFEQYHEGIDMEEGAASYSAISFINVPSNKYLKKPYVKDFRDPKSGDNRLEETRAQIRKSCSSYKGNIPCRSRGTALSNK